VCGYVKARLSNSSGLGKITILRSPYLKKFIKFWAPILIQYYVVPLAGTTLPGYRLESSR